MKSTGTEYCCPECFSDEAIQEFIRSTGSLANCDFCGSKNIDCAYVEDVGGFILKGVEKKYEDPANSVFHDSSEGGYDIEADFLEDILTWQEEIFSEHLNDPHPLFEALISSDGTMYVRKDPYGPRSGGEDDIEAWEQFKKLVKGSHRFTALHKYLGEGEDQDHPAEYLGDLVSMLARDYSATLRSGECIYRARRWVSGSSCSHQDITAPPANKARSNRMSPKGVSLFYGAMDEGTCLAELHAAVGEQIAIGQFDVIKDLNVVDLATERPVYSLFSDDYDFHRDEFIVPFVRHFADSVSQPVGLSDSELDYIPTQAFTEFLRFHPKYQFDGMLYASSLHAGGINVVLFKEGAISCENMGDPGSWLNFRASRVIHV